MPIGIFIQHHINTVKNLKIPMWQKRAWPALLHNDMKAERRGFQGEMREMGIKTTA
ncbi:MULTISPECIES: hypothetical protein [Paenibacillus]|uniref:Uncharacterized protein n=2 Tax=Paenibacillus TaxID=44249 RepID=A0ABW3DEB2_9BACL|nr:hypothetical protein [Aneurinibacillus sp. XH2]